MGALAEGQPLELRSRPASPVVGVEHEYRVLDGDRQVDFERLLPKLGVDGLRVDPTDPNAYRTPWGGLVTADGREAEVATPPIPLTPGCTAELEWRTLAARRALTAVLPDHLCLEGYSTHLNVEVDDDDVVAAGRLFVRHFSPAIMLMLDRPTSPGLLVRPRCGRLELGGEYCIGPHLRAAATFASAAALTCAHAARRGARAQLPGRVRARVRPSNIRAGWYVDRRAFGADLYLHGRATPLRGGPPTAQHHLVDAWSAARPAVDGLLRADELALVDDVVEGRHGLPLECEVPDAPAIGAFEEDAFARAVHPRTRPGFRVEPVAIAWHAVAFRLIGPREAFACIPRADLREFLDELDAGHLDPPIDRFLASPPRGRVLRSSTQTSRPGLFDELGSPGAVAPPERVPGHRLGGRGGGTPRDARRNKHRRPSGRRRLLVTSAALLAMAACAVGAYAYANRDTSSTTVSEGAPIPFTVAFTVESTNVGPHYTGEPVPVVGSRATATVGVACDRTCTFSNAQNASSGPFVNLGLSFRETSPNFLEGSNSATNDSTPCDQLRAVREEASVQLTRDAAGAVTRLSGRYRVVHPGGVEQTTASGTCSTFDITYTFVGTPA